MSKRSPHYAIATRASATPEIAIAISSRLGSIAANLEGGRYIYRSSKTALNSVWRSFAIDNPGLIAAVLHPGWVRTDMGGEEADIDVATSVTGLADVITAQLGHPGAHYLDYRGETLPW